MFASSAPSQNDRWRRCRGRSCRASSLWPGLVDELDENVLEARLVGREVLVGDSEVGEPPHERGDAGPLGVAVELVAERVAVILEPQGPFRKLRRDRGN